MFSNKRPVSSRPKSTRPDYPVPERNRDITLRKTVLFGYHDLLAIGCRALLGLKMGYHQINLSIPGIEPENQPISVQRAEIPAANQKYFSSLQILNCKFEEFSVVTVNTKIPSEKVHHLAELIVNLCKQSKVEKIWVFTSLRVEHVPTQTGFYENIFYTKPVTEQPALPSDCNIKDSLLSALIQMITVVKIPLHIFTLPAYKEPYGDLQYSQSALQGIDEMQELISDVTGLLFSSEFSKSLQMVSDSNHHHMTDMYS